MMSYLTREKYPFGCQPIYAEAFCYLIRENDWQMPTTKKKALQFYDNLLTKCMLEMEEQTEQQLA